MAGAAPPPSCACAAFDAAGCGGDVYVVACTSPSAQALWAALSPSGDSAVDASSGFLCKQHRNVVWRGLFGVVKGEQQTVSDTEEATRARLDFLYRRLSIPTAKFHIVLGKTWKYYNEISRLTEFDSIHHNAGELFLSQLSTGKNVFNFPVNMMQAPHFRDMPRNNVFHTIVNFYEMKPIIPELTAAQHFAFYPEWRAWSRQHSNCSLYAEFVNLCRHNNWDILKSLELQTTIYCKVNCTVKVPSDIDSLMNADVVISMLHNVTEEETENDLMQVSGMFKLEPAGVLESDEDPPLSSAIFEDTE